jgi:hypothetical protein
MITAVLWLLFLEGHAAEGSDIDIAINTRVPGTNWRMEGPNPWGGTEREFVQGVSEILPASYRHPVDRLVLTLEQAPLLPDDLTTPHWLVTSQGRRGRALSLNILGLGDRVDEWIRAHPGEWDGGSRALSEGLVQRQFIHALTHHVDEAQHWSREEDWVRLSGWGSRFLERPPQERDLLAFANPHALKNAGEDLAILTEYFFSPVILPGDPLLPPRCRAPSKWRFLEERTGQFTPSPCADLAQTNLDPERIEDIELVYIRSSHRSPASIAGHVFVVLVFAPDTAGAVYREAYQMVANVTGREAGVQYVVRGLFGGFTATVSHIPYRAMMLYYADMEDRNLYRMPLILNNEEKRALLNRLDEMEQGWNRSYLFFRRNCTQLPVELIEAATGEPLNLPKRFGPDTLLGTLERAERLGALQPRSLMEHSLSDRADTADRLRKAMEDETIAAHPDRAEELRGIFQNIHAGSPRVRDLGYFALRQFAADSDLSPNALNELKRYVLLSDPVERRLSRLSAQQYEKESETKEGEKETYETLDSLWSALGQINLRLQEAKARPLSEAPGSGALLTTLNNPGLTGTSHSPLHRVEVMSTAHYQDRQLTGGLVVSSHLYSARLGEPRRYAMASGLALQLARWELQVSAPDSAVRVHLSLAEFQWIAGLREVGNPGWYFRLFDLEREVREDGVYEVQWLEVGPALELWQRDSHRHHIILSGGVSLKTAGAPLLVAGSKRPSVELSAPVRLSGRLGGREALTGVTATMTWRPLWSTSQTTTWEASATVDAQLYLGRLQGADIALAGAYTSTFPGFDVEGAEQRLSLGIWMERY